MEAAVAEVVVGMYEPFDPDGIGSFVWLVKRRKRALVYIEERPQVNGSLMSRWDGVQGLVCKPAIAESGKGKDGCLGTERNRLMNLRVWGGIESGKYAEMGGVVALGFERVWW